MPRAMQYRIGLLLGTSILLLRLLPGCEGTDRHSRGAAALERINTPETLLRSEFACCPRPRGLGAFGHGQSGLME